MSEPSVTCESGSLEKSDVVDLSKVRVQQLRSLDGDPQVEAMMTRLRREHSRPGEESAGFSSAI